jgi:hypothetical protein
MVNTPKVSEKSGYVLPLPKLYLPAGVTNIGFLCLYYLGSDSTLHFLSVELKPAFALLLFVMWKAFHADQNLPEQIRGWRCPVAISTEISKYTSWNLEPQTVRVYMSKISKAIRKAIQQVKDVPSERVVPQILFERRRGLGARLAVDLEVIDMTQPSDAK